MQRKIPGQKKLTDTSTISFGKHKDKQLANVPDAWLIWYYNNHKFDKDNELCNYIFESGLIKISEQ